MSNEHKTFTGNKALRLEEPLLFDLHAEGRVGVDLPDIPTTKSCLGGLQRDAKIGLPEASESQIVRHFTRLSQKNWAIDAAMYPLGSCTMKHNPRLNEKMARLPGFAHLHPLQPASTIQGALQLINELAHWLTELTGMPAVAMSPAAGAHGELCGMFCIKQAIIAKGEEATRKRVLVPESAHGTNPATAVVCDFTVDPIPADASGRVDMAALKKKIGTTEEERADLAGIMLTNPNTCGLFESDIIEIADLIHEAGGYFYCDGANFNAIVGRVRPGDLGIDCMHINLHKTFSTPHGGGGPGSGPVVLSERLAAFCPTPWVVKSGNNYELVEEDADSFGRLKAFHGQMGMFTRALTYMLSHGKDGLAQVAGDAVLNANYVLESLKTAMTPAYEGPCMHECLFSDTFLKGTTLSTLDLAKAMIDEGFHPMTIYFPLVVSGAILIEPTETESKETLDLFIATIKNLAERMTSGKEDDKAYFHAAPVHTPRKRLDEATAARKPILCCPGWEPENSDTASPTSSPSSSSPTRKDHRP